ncbi:carboxypeptidase B-like [Rhinophrynus dorsalis]
MKKLAETVKLDFWRPESAREMAPLMDVDFHIRADDSEAIHHLLEQNSVIYEVLFHNLQDGIEAQLDNQKVHKSKKHSYTKYNEWEKIVDWTQKMVSKYPNLVSRLDIGNTAEERPMYVLRIGNPRAETKAIFMDCGIHSREWISPAFCQWFVKELTGGYSKDKSIKNLLNKLTFYILPVFNVDGYIWTWTQERMWRKNRATIPNSECIGTDLNRNFNISWGDIGSSNDPCSDIYCGPAEESEKETKNVANFLRSHMNSMKAYITIHSYSQMLLYPYSYTYKLAPNSKELDAISKGAVSELESLYGTSYTFGPSATTIYPTAGSSDDWAYAQGLNYSFTFELRDTGKKGFLLPQSQIKATCEETALAVKYIANYVLSHA